MVVEIHNQIIKLQRPCLVSCTLGTLELSRSFHLKTLLFEAPMFQFSKPETIKLWKPVWANSH
jgi:hypothetical protein